MICCVTVSCSLKNKIPLSDLSDVRTIPNDFVVNERFTIRNPVVLSINDSIFYIAPESKCIQGDSIIFNNNKEWLIPYDMILQNEVLEGSDKKLRSLYNSNWCLFMEDNLELIIEEPSKRIKLFRFIIKPKFFMLALLRHQYSISVIPFDDEVIEEGSLLCDEVDYRYSDEYYVSCHPIFSKRDLRRLNKNVIERIDECKYHPEKVPPGMLKYYYFE